MKQIALFMLVGVLAGQAQAASCYDPVKIFNPACLSGLKIPHPSPMPKVHGKRPKHNNSFIIKLPKPLRFRKLR